MNAGRFFGAAVAACVLVLSLASQPVVAGDNRAADAARAWRQGHERRILEDFFAFLAVPNVSRDLPNVRRNAEHLLQAMQKRGLNPRLLETPGAAPAVYGELLVPGASQTYVFYSHYDGQPLDPREWATPPFEPTLRTARLDRGGQVIALPAAGQPIDPEWRVQARSASDAKGAIFALLSAVDALEAAGIKPRANIKFIFEGEEEMESPHLANIIAANKELLRGDLWFICDGPENPNGRLTIVFGARGIQKLEITVYGANRALHSGHYGNWAPNPALMLAQLLASMKDDDGRVLVDNFYDGVIPLNAIERQAIAQSATDATQQNELALGRVDGGGKSLGELINQPSLNIRGISSGRIGEQAANIIPATATAAIDLRLVKGVTKQGQAERVIAHIRKQGYHVVTADPDDDTRRAHPRIARVIVGGGGYNAVRTPMDLPLAQRVLATARSVRAVAVQPTSGGSVPLDMIVDLLGTETISVSIANYDNNQHSSNEDIKLLNLWNGIETAAALLAME